MKRQAWLLAAALGLGTAGPARADVLVKAVKESVAKPDPKAAYWSAAPVAPVMLMGQPMIVPRPKATTTAQVLVQAVHDGKWAAFRLRWKDPQKNEAGRLGEYSDGAAIQFPIKPGDVPPPVFMGARDNPVHIFHWRAQYQRDRERGKPGTKDLDPNASVDIYPMEFRDHGKLAPSTEGDRERYAPAKAAGNPQAYAKTGCDEIYAEGFSTSSVQEGASVATAVWEGGEWTLVISRELEREHGSVLAAGKKTFAGFAVWQGGKAEVGSRKSVTMVWTPVQVEARK
jgi:hypothetical protein